MRDRLRSSLSAARRLFDRDGPGRRASLFFSGAWRHHDGMLDTTYRLVLFRGKFAVVWHDSAGHRHRQTLATTNRAEADRRLAQHAAAHSAAGAVGRSSRTVAEAWRTYVGSLGARPSAVTAGFQWRSLVGHFADRNAETLTEEDCLRYIAARRAAGRSESTIWSELSRLRSALRYAEHKRMIDRAPKIWTPTQSPPRDKRLTRKQISALIDACELHHVRLFGILAATTGARSSAILGLTWDRVELQRGLIDYADRTIARTRFRRPTAAPQRPTS
jgi:hypothetical protein